MTPASCPPPGVTALIRAPEAGSGGRALGPVTPASHPPTGSRRWSRRPKRDQEAGPEAGDSCTTLVMLIMATVTAAPASRRSRRERVGQLGPTRLS